MPGVTGLAYDAENRLTTANGETYSYGTDNRRVWLKNANGVEYFFFYGIGGRRMGVYRRHDFSLPATGSGLSLHRERVWRSCVCGVWRAMMRGEGDRVLSSGCI